MTKQDGFIRKLVDLGACSCGDLDCDVQIDARDTTELRLTLAGHLDGVLIPSKCRVGPGDACDVVTLTLLRRSLAGRPPELKQACLAPPL